MKRKTGFAILLGMCILLFCPVMVSAAVKTPVVETYTEGIWKYNAKTRAIYYQLDNGKKVTGWAKIKDETYYFTKTGKMYMGWLHYGSEDYYFEEAKDSGAMVTGFYKDTDGNRYYFKKTGAVANGSFHVTVNGKTNWYRSKPSTHILITKKWKKIGDSWYYYNTKGQRIQKWFTQNSRRYYCHPRKGKLFGWNSIGGESYYFTKKGYVKTNCWIVNGDEKWYVNSLGQAVKKVNRSKVTALDYTNVFMIGDSRFYRSYYEFKVGKTIKNLTYIALGSQGYEWLSATAYYDLETRLASGDSSSKRAIVLNLGVNDLTNVKKYIRFVNGKIWNLAEKYNCDVYYVSVNPVNEERLLPGQKKNKNNRQIKNFNKKLKAGLRSEITYINTALYLERNISYDDMTPKDDGLHYTREAYQIILDKIQLSIRPH